MASVGKEKRNGRTLYRVLYRNEDGQRKAIRLRECTHKDAKHIASKVQALVGCRVSGRPFDNDTAAWVRDIGDELAKKLADHGLIERRSSATLAQFIDGYIAGRTEAAANTVRNWKNTRVKLVEFFGKDADLRSITPGDADDWRQALVDREYADATLSKAVKHAKLFFKAAVRKGLCESNAFRELKGATEKDDTRLAFVERGTIEKVLEAAPDTQWRAIIALARYGGLRTPSEILALELQHINLPEGRLTVSSPKTKRQGKAWRVVPIFPELRPYLQDLFDQAADGTRYAITRYRDSNANLRTQFKRILQRAGVEAWPRLFQNLRASRETELANEYPLHVVTAWLGNTPRVASEHYLQVTPAHFAQATGVSEVAQQVVREVAQQVVLRGSAGDCTDRNDATQVESGKAFMPVFPENFAFTEYPRQEANTTAKPRGKLAATQTGGTTGGARSDLELHQLVQKWPELTEHQRRVICREVGIL